MEILTMILITYFLYLTLLTVISFIYNNYEESSVIEQIPDKNNILNLKNNNENEEKISMKSIVGLKSVKEEMKYYFDFINNSEKYKKWKVKLPRGILLVGPPGTGKTLLVKSLAKEIGIPVIHTSGSEFVEMYVGVGASRVRKLFSRAKSHRKCVIFIDEIDAVGKKRGNDTNSERDQTLNQLLVEMDGFDETTNIIVFAATNLVRDLDPALLRSGRFDKKIFFDSPNSDERKELFNLYLEKDMVSDLNYNDLANLTSGLTGADIANIVNQSKINAIQNNNDKITLKDVKTAIDEVMIGREKPERKMTKTELERVSKHEAGHAFMSYVLKNCEPPVKVSILPRGEAALGFSQQKPDDKKLYTQFYILSQICVLLAGRCAEKIFYNELSSGAHDDIEKVTQLVEHYYKNWGMSKKFGPLNFDNLKLKEDSKITKSIVSAVKKLEKFTTDILLENKNQIELLGNKLLEKETIESYDIKEVLDNSLENTIAISI